MASAAEVLPVAGDRQGTLGQKVRRVWRHRLASERHVRATFDDAALARIEAAIAEGERGHRGEVRFAVEAELDLYSLWAGMTPRERALQVFSEQGIWDTEENTGVLIYLQLVDRRIEVIADRGIAQRHALPRIRGRGRCHVARTRSMQMMVFISQGLAQQAGWLPPSWGNPRAAARI